MTLNEIIVLIVSILLTLLLILGFVLTYRRFKRFMNDQQRLNELYISKVYNHLTESKDSETRQMDE